MLLLGKKTKYITRYDSSLLFAISRAEKRKEININPNSLPFTGYDLWNCYEVTWLNQSGKPEIALLELMVPCASLYLIESKSLKLYLMSFSNTKFKSTQEVKSLIKLDLEKKLCSRIKLRLLHPKDLSIKLTASFNKSKSLDNIKVACDTYVPDKSFLLARGVEVKESLCSDLFKSNCPVTNQPDYASLLIRYEGEKINHAGLLKYIISYREQIEFHEQCVERIFVDIKERCKPKSLTVYARYTRRGGIDINPLRTDEKDFKIDDNIRLFRQ